MLALGLAGLIARGVDFQGNFMFTHSIAASGLERLAAYSLALNFSAVISATGKWVLAISVLVVLVVRVVRRGR